MEFQYKEKNKSYKKIIFSICFLFLCIIICIFFDHIIVEKYRIILILITLICMLGIVGCVYQLKLFSIQVKENILYIHNLYGGSYYRMKLQATDIIECCLQSQEGNEVLKHRLGIDLNNDEPILVISTEKVPYKMKQMFFTSQKFIYTIYLYTKNGEDLKLKIDEWKSNAE